MDERLSNLDAKLRVQIRAEILRRHQRLGTTIWLPVRVDVVEYLGSTELVHTDTEGTEIVAVLDSGADIRAQQRIELTLRSDRLHLFDPTTEQNLAA